MPKLQATTYDASALESLIRANKQLRHIRVRRYGDLLILQSGPPKDPISHVRFRRVTRQWWRLEFATHTGRWEVTPFRDCLRPLFNQIVEDFPWTIAPI